MYIASKKRKRISDEDEVMHTLTKARVCRNKLSPKNQANVWAIVQARQQQQQQKRDGIEFGDLEQYIYIYTNAQPSQMSDRKGVKTIFTLDMCSVNVVMIVRSCVELAKEEREKKIQF